MAENRFQKYVKSGGTGAPTVSNANRFDQYQRPPVEPEERNPFADAGMFGLDVLRNFNDTLTFGLYNKGLEATGIDPEASQKLEESNPYAGILGDSLGYILPGLGASAAVGKAVPQLAGNAVKQIAGREALASGAVSATDDLARTGSVDPVGVGIDTATGGLLSAGIAGVGRVISPSARVRASGNEMSDVDRAMTEYYLRSGQDLGVPLNIPEAANAANPVSAVPVRSIFDDALQSPKGSQAAQRFEAQRGPVIENTGRQVANDIGPGVTPDVVTSAADDAINSAKTAASNASRPLYDQAASRRIPPTHVPRNDPGFPEVIEDILNNESMMRRLQRDWEALGGTGPIPQHSTLFLDAVKKRADNLATAAFEGPRLNGLMGDIFSETADTITSRVDRFNPAYSNARDVAQQGIEGVNILKEGPLGRVSSNPTAKGQASTIFGVDNSVDADASRRALALMGAENPDVPQGILANSIDSAVSSNPSNWANAALPTPQARGLALDVLPQGSPAIPTLEAAARVNPYTGQSLPGNEGGLISPYLAAIRNVGKGKVTRMMSEDALDTVHKLGRTGPVQRGITTSSIGTVQTTRKRRREKDRRNRGEY